jgi:pimeloyl-ACP methyl ester carboxylesterase
MMNSPTAGSSPDSAGTSAPSSGGVSAPGWLGSARAWASRAEASGDDALQAWLHCATDAYRAMDTDDRTLADDAAAVATHAAAEVLSRVLQQPGGWSPGIFHLDDARMQLEFRDVAASLRPPLRLRRAQDVPMDAFGGHRYHHAGFGVPVAALASRANEAPLSRLSPQPGTFRNLTAWIEPDTRDAEAPPRLVLADPAKVDSVSIGPHRFALARDTSAGYAWLMLISKLERRGVWGLLGGKEIARRAGVYLLEDYDPDKRPLVMIHGLGSNPLIWANLSNAVWGAQDLRDRYQVWQVVYQTDAPLLAARLRIQDYLDEAWRLLDPEGDARARSGAVLVGHSFGGVIARLLCAQSGDALWNAAFLVPPQALHASAQDLATARRIFFFHPYPGIARAVFLAAPHRGSPSAATVLGHVTRDLVGRRSTEVHALRRIAQANPDAIRPEMRDIIEEGWINSISTLQSEQPVRRVAESLLPPRGFPYHTIAGVQPGRREQTDGVVPLDSAMIPGAASSLVVPSGHRVHENPQAVAEVLRILRE